MHNKEEKVDKLQKMIDLANSIVFFGGAGVSTESGVSDFRSVAGIYRQGGDIEEKLSYKYMRKHPDEFWTAYRHFFMLENIKPNVAHLKLAEMESKSKLNGIITQNIDSLHQDAGSKKVIELHGNGRSFYCMLCGKSYTTEEVKTAIGAVYCSKEDCNGLVRPDVVLFGEKLSHEIVSLAEKLIKGAELLIIGGTSLSVYPAASFITQCSPGCKKVIINRDATSYDQAGDLIIRGPIGDILRRIII